MTAAGKYTTTLIYKNADGQPVRDTETGTYSVNGGKMTIRPVNDEATTRKFGFEKGQLWLHMQEDKLTLYFTRET